jgi:hypothetical protein
MAFIEPPGAYESMKAFKHRIYRVLLTMVTDVADTNNIRIIRKNPEIPWQSVWRTLHTAGLSDAIKSTWYAAIHDIIPTHERLAEINLVPNMTCTRCREKDTLQHRITRCEEGPVIWSWTRDRIEAILRVHPTHIPEEWNLRPTYQFTPNIPIYAQHTNSGRHKSKRRSHGL